jgi:hypothetical protein
MKLPDEREVTQFPLRWNAFLRKQIVAAARDNRRSINSEILSRLERDLARPSAEDRGAA